MQDLGELPLEKAAEIIAPLTSPILESATVDSTEKPKTTEVRKGLVVPDSVHVSIGSENLLEYIGPPVYQKDRLYSVTSPVGVSCGLGYLGNGSGAVMPIEVTVSFDFSFRF